MNIRTEIRPERPNEIPFVTARIKAVNQELRAGIQAGVERAVHEGQLVAEREAPYGPERFRKGVRIRDAIRTSEVRYAPGGAGGGGFYEANLYADSALSPEIEFVMKGTADEGRGLIKPSRGNVALEIQEEGEKVSYRAWVPGQEPNTWWWDAARLEVERILDLGIHEIK